jgi:hypothetical protein
MKQWKVKVKQSHYRPEQAQRVPGGWGPRFQDNRHMKVVRLSTLPSGHLYPREIFLVLISVRVWVISRVIARLEGLCQWKIPMTPEIEPATSRLAAQCINQLRHRVTLPRRKVQFGKQAYYQYRRGRPCIISRCTFVESALCLGCGSWNVKVSIYLPQGITTILPPSVLKFSFSSSSYFKIFHSFWFLVCCEPSISVVN